MVSIESFPGIRPKAGIHTLHGTRFKPHGNGNAVKNCLNEMRFVGPNQRVNCIISFPRRRQDERSVNGIRLSRAISERRAPALVRNCGCVYCEINLRVFLTQFGKTESNCFNSESAKQFPLFDRGLIWHFWDRVIRRNAKVFWSSRAL